MGTKEDRLAALFKLATGAETESVIKMPQSGSYREYYRIVGGNYKLIGTYNEDTKENRAFIGFTEHFHELGLPVPQIVAKDLAHNIYLQNDLGDLSLYAYLTETKKCGEFPEELVKVYKKVVELMPRFQIGGAKGLDYDLCYPRASFDRQSMMWDLNYFKYYFLKLAQIPFDEQLLEDDYNTLCDYLLRAPRDYFLYRDFQSRNIMLVDGEPYLIDYQGGRKGALQYDLASLLFDAKADIPTHIREQLLDHYLDQLRQYTQVNQAEFKGYFGGYALIRILQAMGAYGFRGFYEKKMHFLLSVPYAINNLVWLLDNMPIPVSLPNLMTALRALCGSERLLALSKPEHKLKVRVESFSYHIEGIPEYTKQEHGGGFVFDCRSIHNPGRYEQYKTLTGKDLPVIDFFAKEPEMHEFLHLVYSMIGNAVEKYSKRKFDRLAVAFGCTGGQHRSVYSAEMLAKYLRGKYEVDVELSHAIFGRNQ